MKTKIHRLDPSVSKKFLSQTDIPTFTSCVIEVIKNSIDAGATKLTVEIDLKLLNFKVTDNGEGITHDDMINVGKYYYTSKFTDEREPLCHKGVALAAISESSLVEIESKYGKDEVYKMVIHKNQRKGLDIAKEVGRLRSHGTIISVTDLFASMPVRRKMMLNESRVSHIQKIKYELIPFLISYPNITFTLREINNNKKLNMFSITGIYKDRIESGHIPREVQVLRSLYGSDTIPLWDSIEYIDEDWGVVVKGVISRYPVSSSGKICQHVIYNNKRVRISNEINNYIYQSNYYENHKQPKNNAAFVFSIHKTERFKSSVKCNDKLIESVICKAIANFLITERYIINTRRKKNERKRTYDSDRFSLISPKKSKNSVKSPNNDEFITDDIDIDYSQDSYIPSPLLTPEPEIPSITSKTSKYFSSNTHISSVKRLAKEDLVHCQVISQIDDKFILIKMISTSDIPILALIDQHAAGERVILEQLLADFFSSQQQAIQLRIPITIELLNPDYEILSEYKLIFEQLGIKFSFKKDCIIVTHLPSVVIEKSEDASFIYKLIINHGRDLTNGKASKAIWVPQKTSSTRASLKNHSSSSRWPTFLRCCPTAILNLLNSTACRAAVKFGDKLSIPQCEELVRGLSQCYFPFQCAHGRPTTIPLASISETL